MKILFSRLLSRAAGLSDVQPLLSLFLGGALLAVFLAMALRRKSSSPPATAMGYCLLLGQRLQLLLWASLMVGFLVAAGSLLRVYLRQSVANFQHDHGRVTGANYNAVRTIWGPEQSQDELRLDLYWEEEVTERIEYENITKPAILRKKTVRHSIDANPFVSARHEVTLRQNARKKGSAFYGGYETQCRFDWHLKNPATRDVNGTLKFPLPADGAMYNDLYATLDGKDILPQMQLKDNALLLPREFKPGEELEIAIGFQSRGMSCWYLQVREAREIRDFTLTMNLPDLPKNRLNYPEGCMTPTEISPTADNQGSVLTYRLDNAISNKGMGIVLPQLPQPGAATNAVLNEIERSWLLLQALFVLGLVLSGARHAVILSVLFATATALGYGLLGDFSDLLFGFWGTAILVLLPLFLELAWLLKRILPGAVGRAMAAQLLLYGIALPAAAGLDSNRQSLYFNLCAALFLSYIAWLLARRLRDESVETASQIAGTPVQPAAA